MKILMLSPEPYFQPRGTPISIYFRIRALSSLGHRVDLVTYHLGRDELIKNLRIIRTPGFFIKKIKIGPSIAKIPLDFLLFGKAAGELFKKRYELLFSHEEAAFLGLILAKIWRIPHVYDMHSSLPHQFKYSSYPCPKLLKKIFLWLENFALKNSQSIAVVCPDLYKKVTEEGFGKKTVLLENSESFALPESSSQKIERIRERLALGDKHIVLYTGNLQPYQGIPLLLQAAERIKEKNVIFLIIGGGWPAVETMKRIASDLSISNKVIFHGQVEPSQIPLYLAMADVLVSPRKSGTNTPLKIYSYLKSGKPLVATRIRAHIQVLNDKISILANPDAESLAEGISFALSNREAKRRAQAAKIFAEKAYSHAAYLEKMSKILENTFIKKEKRG